MMRTIRHTGIVVKDLKKMVHFYRDVLGLKVIKRMNESGSYLDSVTALKKTKVTTIKMKADNEGLIELLYFRSHPSRISNRRGLFDTGISHIAFGVKDAGAEYKKLKKNGIRFNSLPQISPDGCAKVAFFRDPEGNMIEIMEVLNKNG
jgi:catechol 2,3-dioxygenase-like lactoylglutathione lyase family enzyme